MAAAAKNNNDDNKQDNPAPIIVKIVKAHTFSPHFFVLPYIMLERLDVLPGQTIKKEAQNQQNGDFR